MNGRTDCARLLLDAGADPNTKDGVSGLCRAVRLVANFIDSASASLLPIQFAATELAESCGDVTLPSRV